MDPANVFFFPVRSCELVGLRREKSLRAFLRDLALGCGFAFPAVVGRLSEADLRLRRPSPPNTIRPNWSADCLVFFLSRWCSSLRSHPKMFRTAPDPKPAPVRDGHFLPKRKRAIYARSPDPRISFVSPAPLVVAATGLLVGVVQQFVSQ
jgi:hypothetical protein